MSIIYEPISQNVRRIVINRPHKRNAINSETLKSLLDAVKKFNQDDSAHAAILAGTNGNFCSGYDLSEMVDIVTAMPRLQQIEQTLLPLSCDLGQKKPLIAAIEGFALGLGYEIALRCDFRVADRDSRMGFLNRRFGIPIMNGGTIMLPKMIGRARALDLICTGRAQLAAEALSYGLINHMSDVGCAQGRSTNLARCLAKFHQPALLNDLESAKASDNKFDLNQTTKELLSQERKCSLEYLRQCGPLEVAVKFLKGELCRHGNTDVGNILAPEPQVSL